jgi:Protein of unknown function (DUF2726)
MFEYSWVAGAAFAAAGCAVGAVTCSRWFSWQMRRRWLSPQQWLLAPRALLSAEEHEVWLWLKRAFPDHNIMVKTAVSRFTRPRDKKHSRLAYQTLNDVYCTFSVSAQDGSVIACLDVAGKQGLLRSHRDMKESILANCGIAYSVVRSGKLPATEEIRGAFLGLPDRIDDEDTREDAPSKYDPFAEELSAFSKSFRERNPLAQPSTPPKVNLEQRPFECSPLITRSGVADEPDEKRQSYWEALMPWRGNSRSILRTGPGSTA